MSQALSDILAKRDYSEPPEIRQIKAFVLEHVGITPTVSITNESYVIRTGSAGAAGLLRTKVYSLQKELNTTKRIIIRIA